MNDQMGMTDQSDSSQGLEEMILLFQNCIPNLNLLNAQQYFRKLHSFDLSRNIAVIVSVCETAAGILSGCASSSTTGAAIESGHTSFIVEAVKSNVVDDGYLCDERGRTPAGG